MIKKNVVLILGAGSSVPFGFPTGSDLIRQILEFRDPENHEYLISGRESKTDWRNFFKSLEASTAGSIDSFVQRRPDFKVIASKMIAQCLVTDEMNLRSDGLYKTDNWFEILWPRLIDGLNTMEELIQRTKISFVTLNYDVALDLRIADAISHGFGKPGQERLKEFIEKFGPFHLHGRIGGWPWERARRQITDVSWASQSGMRGNVIGGIAEDLIYGFEQKGDGASALAKEAIEAAEVICFMGFGFHPDNLGKLFTLKPNGHFSCAKRMFANDFKGDSRYWPTFHPEQITVVEGDCKFMLNSVSVRDIIG